MIFSSIWFDSNCRHVQRSLVGFSVFMFSGLSGLGPLHTSSTVDGEDHQPSAGEKWTDHLVLQRQIHELGCSTEALSTPPSFSTWGLYCTARCGFMKAASVFKHPLFPHCHCFCFYFSIWESGISRQLSVTGRPTSRSSEFLTAWFSPSRRRLMIRWSWPEICACEGKKQFQLKNTSIIIRKMRSFCVCQYSHLESDFKPQWKKGKFGKLIK